jgi:hypothetical protein
MNNSSLTTDGRRISAAHCSRPAAGAAADLLLTQCSGVNTYDSGLKHIIYLLSNCYSIYGIPVSVFKFDASQYLSCFNGEIVPYFYMLEGSFSSDFAMNDATSGVQPGPLAI